MKPGILMTINAVFAFLFGLGFLLAPAAMMNAYGAEVDPELLQMVKFFGAALLGYGLLTWFARNSEDSVARRAIVLSLMLSFGIGFVVALIGQLKGVVNALGWFSTGLYLFFALGYLSVYMARKKSGA